MWKEGTADPRAAVTLLGGHGQLADISRVTSLSRYAPRSAPNATLDFLQRLLNFLCTDCACSLPPHVSRQTEPGANRPRQSHGTACAHQVAAKLCHFEGLTYSRRGRSVL